MSGSKQRPPDERHRKLAVALVGSGNPGGYKALARGVLPDRDRVLQVVERLHALLLAETLPGPPSAEGALRQAEQELADLEAGLAGEIRLALDFPLRLGHAESDARQPAADSAAIARQLVDALPALREHLFEDATAAWRGDPSCHHPIEALYAFPGVYAITRHRIAHILYSLGVPLLPRLIAEEAHRRTGIDIHAGATIGRAFFVDHGTGVVIGETAIVGDRVTLYQGVTLGARSFPVDESGRLIKGLPRHPIVEDDVTIYASATILGRITVGRGSVIGGNVWLTHGVPPDSRIAQAEARQSGFEDGAGI